MPAAETVIEVPVVPFDQMTVPPQSLTLKFMLVPEQTILSASSDRIVGVDGMGLTTIVWVAETELAHPFKLQMALYVPDDETVIEVPLVPFDQITIPPQLLTLSFIFVPAQIILSESSDAIAGVDGIGCTTIV